METPSLQSPKHPTAPVLSSSRGRRSLYIFLVAVVALLIGLASIVWPRVTIHITPRFELVQVTVPIKVDLDVVEPSFSSGLLPGQLVPQQASGGLPDPAVYYTASVPSGTLAVPRNLVDQLVNVSLQQGAGEERTIRPGSTALVWQNPVKAASGRLYTWPLRAEAYFYRQFPLTVWQQHLGGLSVPEATAWLTTQVGVAAVTVDFYPPFLANISQKMPFNSSNLSFSLDIN